MLGYSKMAEFLKVFAAYEEDDTETSIIDSDDDVIILAAVSSFMRRSLNRVNRYFEATIPAYLLHDKRNARVVGSGSYAHRPHSNWKHIWAACDSAREANTAVALECCK